MPRMRLAPIASTRACSIASNTARARRRPARASRAAPDRGRRRRSAAASAWPRMTAISVLVGTREGSGSRAILPLERRAARCVNTTSHLVVGGDRAARSAQGSSAPRLGAASTGTISLLDSGLPGRACDAHAVVTPLRARLELQLSQRHVGGRLRQVLAEAALIVLGDQPRARARRIC